MKYIPLSFHQTKQKGVIYCINTNEHLTKRELIIFDEPGFGLMQVADSVYRLAINVMKTGFLPSTSKTDQSVKST